MENIIDIVRTVANKNDIEIAYINNAAQLRVNWKYKRYSSYYREIC